jgi:hypothetical protein
MLLAGSSYSSVQLHNSHPGEVRKWRTNPLDLGELRHKLLISKLCAGNTLDQALQLITPRCVQPRVKGTTRKTQGPVQCLTAGNDYMAEFQVHKRHTNVKPCRCVYGTQHAGTPPVHDYYRKQSTKHCGEGGRLLFKGVDYTSAVCTCQRCSLLHSQPQVPGYMPHIAAKPYSVQTICWMQTGHCPAQERSSSVQASQNHRAETLTGENGLKP